MERKNEHNAHHVHPIMSHKVGVMAAVLFATSIVFQPHKVGLVFRLSHEQTLMTLITT